MLYELRFCICISWHVKWTSNIQSSSEGTACMICWNGSVLHQSVFRYRFLVMVTALLLPRMSRCFGGCSSPVSLAEEYDDIVTLLLTWSAASNDCWCWSRRSIFRCRLSYSIVLYSVITNATYGRLYNYTMPIHATSQSLLYYSYIK